MGKSIDPFAGAEKALEFINSMTEEERIKWRSDMLKKHVRNQWHIDARKRDEERCEKRGPEE